MAGWLLYTGTFSTNRLCRNMSAREINRTYSKQMAEPGFEPRSVRCPSKYCNHSATEADAGILMGDGDWFTELRYRAVRATTRRTGRALGSGGRVPPPPPIKSVWTVWISDRRAPLHPHPLRAVSCSFRRRHNKSTKCLFICPWLAPAPECVCICLPRRRRRHCRRRRSLRRHRLQRLETATSWFSLTLFYSRRNHGSCHFLNGANVFNLRHGSYVFACVCLSVCLLTGLLKNC